VSNEEFEAFIQSQLHALKAQIEIIKKYLQEYEDRNRTLKKIMSEDLIGALLLRFEKNEERIIKLDERLESMHFNLNEKLSQEIRKIKDDLSESQLSRSIARLLEQKEIKVDSKPLDELKKDY
jgi:light-regulated signal transduction histidine kinase (bacteriophytochrome)